MGFAALEPKLLFLITHNSARFTLQGFGKMVDIGDNAGATIFASEFDGGFDFGEHGTRFEIAIFDKTCDVFRSSFGDSFLVW